MSGHVQNFSNTSASGVAGPAGSTGTIGPTGSIGPTGTIGPTGATGPQGSPGLQASPGINLFNIGATLGSFTSFNFIGGLSVSTGANNIVQVNSIPDFVQVGITGAGTGSVMLASGPMIPWSTQQGQALGRLGHTNIGTAAGLIAINKAAYYQVNNKINFTGLPSGVVIQMEQRLGATGGNGSGTPISQSVTYFENLVYTGVPAYPVSMNSSYVVYSPSGTNISTWLTYLSPGGGGSPIFLSPTGTSFDIRSIGA